MAHWNSGFTQLENGGSFHSYVNVYQRVSSISSNIPKIPQDSLLHPPAAPCFDENPQGCTAVHAPGKPGPTHGASCWAVHFYRGPQRGWISYVFPQQRKLMGSSAQNSSGVHWCRCRVSFNEVPEKVPKVPEKIWEALVQSQVTFKTVPEKEKVWEALVPRKVPEKVPEKVWEALVLKPGQVQQGSGEGSGEGSGRLWSGFWRRLRRRGGWLWCSQVRFNRVPEKAWEALQGKVRFNRVPEKVPEKVWEGLVQSQVGFNRVPEKVSEKVPGGFGAEPGQVQQGSGECSGEGLGGFGAEPGQVQQDLCPFNSRKHSWGVASAWLGSTLPNIL